MPRRLSPLLGLALLFFASRETPAQDADASAGERVAALAGLCATCHGAGGVSEKRDVPSLAGQHEPYLFETLKELKGETGSSAAMREITRSLSEEDLKNLARHFATQPYVRPEQTVPAERAARGREVYQRLCQLCHRDEGRSTSYAEYPLLAGQGLDYMLLAMDRILSGTRRVDAIKRDMLSLATRPQIDDAIHFFAAQKVSPDQVQTAVSAPERKTRRQRFRSQ